MLDLRELDTEHNMKMKTLEEKQLKLFNAKKVEKWENPDASRLPKAD
jgi:hypothetical protein